MKNADATPNPSTERETEAWYERYYRKRGNRRNDLFSNPEVLFQALAFEKANLRALSRLPIDPKTARVLDVGCGDGGSLLTFIRLGFDPSNLFGIDISAERIANGRKRLPNVTFQCENGADLSFASGTFDIVFESTMFVQLTNADIATTIATEMLRVAKPGGFVVLVDWRYSKPWDPHYKGLNAARIRRLFKVGQRSKPYAIEKGALIPPLGRFMSRYLGAFYFPVQLLMPFAVGQVTTVLERTEGTAIL